MDSKKVLFSLICFLCIVPLSWLSAGSAKPSPEDEAVEAEAYAVDEEYDRGPVKFYMKVDKKEITIAEGIILVLEAVTDNSFEVAFPVMDGELAQFSVRDIDRPPPAVLDENTLKLSYTYHLEPFLSGEYTIPPLTFRYWEAGDNEDEARLLETDEVKITVKSLLPGDRENLALKDIIDPVPPPPPSLSWLWILLGVLAAGGGAAVLLVLMVRERRRKADSILYTPAHEIAFRQLRKLVAREYVEKEEYKFFYTGISNILRHYIENRFGLQAPESTTEEFLADLNTSPLLPAEQKEQLKEFLSHCDLVKFAELVPTSEQIQRTFDLCKQFILNTQDREATVADTGDTFRPQAGEVTALAGETAVPESGEERTESPVVPAPRTAAAPAAMDLNDIDEKGMQND